MRDDGTLERLARGLYRLADLPPLSHPDYVTVARKVPEGVICLLSALAYHEITSLVPHLVDVALEMGAERPRLDYPPLRVFWFSGAAWSEGIEAHQLDGIAVRFYGPAKCVADAFKMRRRLGLDIAIEALRNYRQSAAFSASELVHYTRVCRVERIVRPYLEVLL